MTLKEFITHEVENLGDRDLQAVADYVTFLKFRSRTSFDEAQVAAMYRAFEREDRELAEAGMNDYADALAQEDAQ